jgi:hypothetical protein
MIITPTEYKPNQSAAPCEAKIGNNLKATAAETRMRNNTQKN